MPVPAAVPPWKPRIEFTSTTEGSTRAAIAAAVRTLGEEAGACGEGAAALGAGATGGTTTGADGSYCFNNLPPGSYAISETQPAGYLPGLDTVGTLGGTEAEYDAQFSNGGDLGFGRDMHCRRNVGGDAAFVASGSTQIDGGSFIAQNGGQIHLPQATSYTNTTNAVVLQATGAGSVLSRNVRVLPE